MGNSELRHNNDLLNMHSSSLTPLRSTPKVQKLFSHNNSSSKKTPSPSSRSSLVHKATASPTVRSKVGKLSLTSSTSVSSLTNSCTPPSKKLGARQSPLSARASPNSKARKIPSFASSKLSTPLKDEAQKLGVKQVHLRTFGSPCNVGPVGVSPGARKVPTKTRTYDRFIPSRSAMDLASAQLATNDLKKVTTKHLDAETLAYQEEMAKACGIALDQRILAFKAEAPVATRTDLRTSWNRPLKNPNSKVAKRKIPTTAEKILDAPGMVDDYYLNLLHWSSRNMLAVGLENTIYIWDANSGSVQEFLTTSENDPVTSLQWTLDGSYLAVGLNSGDTQIWDADSAAKIRSMKGHSARVGVLSWDKHIVSSGCRDGSIWNHDVRIAKHKVAELINHSAEVCGLSWRPDGQLLASGGNDNKVNIWDARTSVPKMSSGAHRAAVKAISWCPWQLNVVCTGGGSNDKSIHFWNTTTAKKLNTIVTESQVTSLHWSKEYKEIVSTHGFPNNHISIWSYPSLSKIADLEGHDMRILHSSLSPDGQTLATCASDESLKFWKTFEKRPKKSKDNGNSAGDEEDQLSLATHRLTIR